MDDKLLQIIKIRPLQTKVFVYRSSMDEYRKMLKQTSMSELRNLVNVEMLVEDVQIKLPDKDSLPPINKELKMPRVGYLLNECKMVEEGIELLGL